MTDRAPEAWAEEIRDYLLGRLSKARSISMVDSERHRFAPPILTWWILEGRQYPLVGGNLVTHWEEVERRLQQLERTWNPALRFSRTADGPVDWPRTFAAGHRPDDPNREYVISSTRTGLDDQELAAIRGWRRWIARLWTEARGVEGPSSRDHDGWAPPVPGALRELSSESTPSLRELSRWAGTTRRSRWPILREVLAPSLRAALEGDELDRLPLPVERAVLFELVCVVRIARHFEPQPTSIRWLHREVGENSLRFGAHHCRYQVTIERERVVNSRLFTGALRTALTDPAIDVPRRLDALFSLGPNPARVTHLLVECKSGRQRPGSGLFQLMAYDAALGLEGDGIVRLEITEEPGGTSAPHLRSWRFCGLPQLEQELQSL